MEIGQGAFAKVCKGYCPAKDMHIGIKIMSLENIMTSLEEIQAEVRAMKLAKHENILGLHCAFVVKSDLWLIMPLMDKGSCYYLLKTFKQMGKIAPGHGLSEDVVATLLRELLQGLDYIHSNHQIHRDIKAGNILLATDGRVALADFGVAGWMTNSLTRGRGKPKAADDEEEKCKVRGGKGEEERRERESAHCCRCPAICSFLSYALCPHSNTFPSSLLSSPPLLPSPLLLQTFVGTPCWMAPEVMEQQRGYDEKADIWSVGITALELLKGYAPYSRFPPMQVLIKTLREPPPSIRSYGEGAVKDVSTAFIKFVDRCLQKDPSLRPSARDLLSDPFLKKAFKTSKLAETVLAELPIVGSAEAKKLQDAKPEGYGAGPAGGAEEAAGAAGAAAAAGFGEWREGRIWEERGGRKGDSEGQRIPVRESQAMVPSLHSTPFLPPLLSPTPSSPAGRSMEEYVSGTTWVFPDEIQVKLAAIADAALEEAAAKGGKKGPYYAMGAIAAAAANYKENAQAQAQQRMGGGAGGGAAGGAAGAAGVEHAQEGNKDAALEELAEAFTELDGANDEEDD